jgi:hypothetical protein
MVASYETSPPAPGSIETGLDALIANQIVVSRERVILPETITSLLSEEIGR